MTKSRVASSQTTAPAKASKATRADTSELMSKAEELTARGKMATSGTACGAAVMESFQSSLMGKDVGFEPIYGGLVDLVKNIQAGDLRMLESMLFSQASALQTIFSDLARRASAQTYLKQFQTYLTLALKAQAQSRATLEALIELKQPRQQPTFVKQANIAAGHQQVNNAYASASARTPDVSHAENSSTEPNRLLEQQHDNELDIGTQGQTVGADPHLEAVGAGYRAAFK